MKYGVRLLVGILAASALLFTSQQPVFSQMGGGYVCGLLTTVELPFSFVFIPDGAESSDPVLTWVAVDSKIRTASGGEVSVDSLEGKYLRIWVPDFDYDGGDLWGNTVPLLTSVADYEIVPSCNDTPTPVLPPTPMPTATRRPTATPRPPTATPIPPAATPRPLRTVVAPTPTGISFGCAGFGQCAQPSPTPIPAELGVRAQTSAVLRVRSSPDTSATLLATVPAGTQMYILNGPVVANGYTWWKVQTIASGNQVGVTGWCAGNWLTLFSGESGKPKLVLKYEVTPLASQRVTVLKQNSFYLSISNEGTAPFVLSNPGDYRIDIKLREGVTTLDRRIFSQADDLALPQIAVILPGEQIRFRVSDLFYFLQSVRRGSLSVSFVTNVQSGRPRVAATASGTISIDEHEDTALNCSAELLKATATLIPVTLPVALPVAYAEKLAQCNDDFGCAAKEFFWFFTELFTNVRDVSKGVRMATDLTKTVNDFAQAASTKTPTCMIAADAFSAYGMTWVQRHGSK